ncbi:hypothetical protein Aduo_015640 [Ancylostoma duodenale]
MRLSLHWRCKDTSKQHRKNIAVCTERRENIWRSFIGKRESFENSLNDETNYVAALCDPRVAFLVAVLTAAKWKSTSERFIRPRVHPSDRETSPSSSQAEEESGKRCSRNAPVWEILTREQDAEADSVLAKANAEEDELQIQVQQYSVLLKKARLVFDSDPLEWWRAHKNEFSLIAEAVGDYLVAPVTSVDCERLFSMAGMIYGNRRRGRLLSKTARLLLMIKTSSHENVARTSKSWT